jgi:hypothetical protein
VTDRLDIFADRCNFIVAWDDEGCPGLALGEDAGDELEHDIATKAAEAIGTHDRRADGAFVWESESDAKKALRAARAAVRAAKAGKPLPEWAITATAAGWKPPKGWTP